MKALVAGLTSIMVLFLGGWGFGGLGGDGSTAIEAMPNQRNQLGSIVGAWHSFPAGIVVQFDPDGTAQFGVDPGGEAFGFEAVTQKEGKLLSIKFTNYDGEDDLCQATPGVYQLHTAVGGAIKFVPVDDGCQLRLNMLQGAPEWGFERIFHPLG